MDTARSEHWGLSQTVTNWDSVDTYKDRHQSIASWLPDQIIANRVVAIFREPNSTCSTYVQSGKAGVITTVIRFSQSSPIDECAKAVEATTAVIDQIPR